MAPRDGWSGLFATAFERSSNAMILTDGRRVTDKETLARIAALAIPPAWAEVWISPWPRGHIQATGRDARGRSVTTTERMTSPTCAPSAMRIPSSCVRCVTVYAVTP